MDLGSVHTSHIARFFHYLFTISVTAVDFFVVVSPFYFLRIDTIMSLLYFRSFSLYAHLLPLQLQTNL